MAIERLPERRKWHEIYRGASACNGSAYISALNPIICYENEKQCKLQGIVLTAARGPMTFQVVVRDQDGTNPFVRKHYRLEASGMIIDRANWPDSLVKWGANKEICVIMALSAASGTPFTADLELLELMG